MRLVSTLEDRSEGKRRSAQQARKLSVLIFRNQTVLNIQQYTSALILLAANRGSRSGCSPIIEARYFDRHQSSKAASLNMPVQLQGNCWLRFRNSVGIMPKAMSKSPIKCVVRTRIY
jgi:hypothetical protein